MQFNQTMKACDRFPNRFGLKSWGESDWMFPVKDQNTKARVLGLIINGQSKAYPFLELAFENKGIQDSVSGQLVTIRYNAESETAQAFDESANPIPATELYWFAWYAFHPDTEIFNSAKTPPNRRKRWQVDATLNIDIRNTQ